MRERVETFFGCVWLEHVGNGMFGVFGTENGRKPLGTVAEKEPESRYLWRVTREDAPTATAPTKRAAVVAVARRARWLGDG